MTAPRAPRKTALRAVAPGEKAPARPKVRKTVTQAAADGTHVELLEAMRDRIAKAVENPNTSPRDLAALTRRLQEIAREIEAAALQAKQEGESGSAPDEEFDSSAI